MSGAEFAAISLIDTDRQWFKSQAGLGDLAATTREVAFCAHTILTPAINWVENASADPRFCDNPLVTDEPGIRFYAGAPLVVRGQNVGSLCIFDSRPRAYDPELAALLEELATLVSERCALHQTETELALALNHAQRSNAALGESEDRYGGLFRGSSEGLVVIDVGGGGEFTFADINPAMAAVTGFAPADFIGRTPSEVFGPDQGAVLEAKYRGCVDLGQPMGWTETYALPAGERRFRVGLVPLPDGAGRISRLLISGQDQTELLRGQDALRESEARHLGVFEGLTKPLFIVRPVDDGFVFEAGNRAFSELFGATCVVDRTLEQIMPADWLEGMRAPLWKCLASGQPVDIEDVVCASDASRCFQIQLAPILDAGGGLGRVFGSLREVTEQRAIAEALRATEQNFEALFENSADALFVFARSADDTFAYDRVNKAAAMLVGKSEAELRGRGPEQVFTAEAADTALERYRRCVRERRVLDFDGELESGGVQKFFHALLVPLLDADGEPRGVLASARDITERRNEEVRSRETQKLQAIGQLAGGIAHDFNNLLLIIDGFARQASDNLASPERARDGLSEILQATERAKSLIQQLLVFSRRQIRDRRAFVAALSVAETDRLLRPLLGARYQLKIAVKEIANFLHVDTDPSEFSQALMNLAINARDAMPAGGVITIGLDAVTLDDAFCRSRAGLVPGPHLELTVRDEGQGMDARTLERVFDPFFTTKEQGRGTGLGLAMVHGFAQQSGGAIQATSSEGVGSTFTLYLPVAKEAAVQRPELSADAPRGRGETVLLVEDDPQVLRLVRDLAEALGYVVLTATDGMEALEAEAAHAGPIHMLLTDVVMPAMGGFELADVLRTSRPETGVIYMTGYPTRGELEGVRIPAGATLLQKPFSPGDLARSLHDRLASAFLASDRSAA